MTKEVMPLTDGRPWRADEDIRHTTVGICHLCRHRDPDGLRCTAYPSGIPLDVLTGKRDHRKPQPDDGGIRFAPKPATTTDGPVSYCITYDATGRADGALWVGDDGSADFMGEIEPCLAWRERLQRAYQQDTPPHEFLAYWCENGGNGITWSAGALTRAASLDVLRERIAKERGA